MTATYNPWSGNDRSGATGTTVICHECGALIDVSAALVAPIRARLAQENEATLQAERVAIRREESERIRAELHLEHEDLYNQVQEDQARLAESREAELELRKQIRELIRQAEEAQLLQARREDVLRQAVVAEAEERYGAQLRAKDDKLARVEHELGELRRKTSTGSPQDEGLARQQLLGEALNRRFPTDEVIVIRQGEHGADIRHVVRDLAGRRLGEILWESKRAQNWNNDWLPKLKADRDQVGANVGVIASATLPKGADPVSQVDGVWVCDFAHAMPLALALRETVVQIAGYEAANSSREEASARVYDYIASGGFTKRVVSMVQTIAAQREDLAREQRAMQRSWKVWTGRLDHLESHLASMVGELLGLGATLSEEAWSEFEFGPGSSSEGDDQSA